MRRLKVCLCFVMVLISISLIACANNGDTSQEQQIVDSTKDYILNGQDNLPEVVKLNWSETFLEQVDINHVYQEYLTSGGKSDDIESFAQYLTLNAPILDNWEELFKSDFANVYGEKVTRFENLEGDLYQVYVEIEGAEVPYVVVNARTGYYHG